MASKQIGKFRQKVGELVGLGQTKTTFSDDFKELEADVQLRGAGLEKLTDATDAYIKWIEKRKELETEGDGKVKVLPFEALGVAMMAHGSELGDESVYGAALGQFGRAHCKIATLQEDYATALRETYLQKLNDGIVAIQEYQALRKKLDSRRLALDSYATKVSKAKKDKDRTEAEEEHEIAKHRYDEMSEEVHDRMLSIQKREGEQFAELTEFLETEISFVSLYHDALLKLKEDWPNPASANANALTHRRSFAQHPHEASPRPSYEESPAPPPTRKRANTSTAAISTPAHSRRGSESLAAANTGSSNGSDGASKDPAPSPVKSRKGSVSGWMGSLSRSRKNSTSSKKNFQSLRDDEPELVVVPARTEHNLDLFKARAIANGHLPSYLASDAIGIGILDDEPVTLRDRKPTNSTPVRRSSVARRPPTLTKIRAIHNVSIHAPDELSFRTGDVLTVLDEDFTGRVDDTMIWVRAEKDGFVGMVPFNYFEVIPHRRQGQGQRRSSTTRKPPFRSNGGSPDYSDAAEDTDSPESSLLHDQGRSLLVSNDTPTSALWDRYEINSSSRCGDEYGSDGDELHPFGDPDDEEARDYQERLRQLTDFDADPRQIYQRNEQLLAARKAKMLGLDPDASARPPPPLTSHASSSSSSSSNLLSPPSSLYTTATNGRKTAPPSPVRPPVPIPVSSSNTTISSASGRQLPQGIANAVAAAASGKKPPPPPPPARRAQSSANLHNGQSSIGSLNGSVSSFGSGSGAAREPPPPPPIRRPTISGRTMSFSGIEKSPFDP